MTLATSSKSPGEGHTLVACGHEQPMKVFFIVKGPLVWLDETGEAAGYFDDRQTVPLVQTQRNLGRRGPLKR